MIYIILGLLSATIIVVIRNFIKEVGSIEECEACGNWKDKKEKYCPTCEHHETKYLK